MLPRMLHDTRNEEKPAAALAVEMKIARMFTAQRTETRTRCRPKCSALHATARRCMWEVQRRVEDADLMKRASQK
jgi:hypothetical protein